MSKKRVFQNQNIEGEQNMNNNNLDEPKVFNTNTDTSAPVFDNPVIEDEPVQNEQPAFIPPIPEQPVQKTLTAQILHEESTCEYTVKIDKKELKRFIANAIPTHKEVRFTEINPQTLSTLFLKTLGGSEANSNRIVNTFFPSHKNAYKIGKGVTHIPTLVINQNTVKAAKAAATNLVELAKEETTIEAERIVETLDSIGIFDKRYPTPQRINRNTGDIDFYLNTLGIICKFLDVEPDYIESKFHFTMQEEEYFYFVNFRKKIM